MSQETLTKSLLAWEATAVGEYSLSIIALAILWVVFLVSLRRWNASLRLPYIWLKCAIPFVFLSITLSDVVAIIYLIDATSDYLSPPLDEAALCMPGISVFFASIADILILLCLVEMALGFLRTLGKDSRNYKIIRYSNFCMMGVLFALDIAALGKDESFVTNNDWYDPGWTTTFKLYGAESTLYWILSLGLLFLSIFVLYSSTQKKEQQNLTSRFLATAILNFIRATWEFAIAVRYYINFDFTGIPLYVTVVDPILYTWITLLIFGILIAIFKMSA